MKINRLKKIQNTINFYKQNYNFHSPYKILIDSTLYNLCLKINLDLIKQLTKYMQDNLVLFTTPCVIKELEKSDKFPNEVLKFMKTCKIYKCGHNDQSIKSTKCILSILEKDENDEHFFIATQKIFLHKKLENLASYPLISIKINTIFLHKPTLISKKLASDKINNLLVSDFELQTLNEIKKQELGEKNAINNLFTKRRKAKGPNPLSCLKKKAKLQNEENTVLKKKRRKKKLSKHIRKLLNKEENSKLNV